MVQADVAEVGRGTADRHRHLLLLDLDGTLYVGSQVVPGAPETVRWLRLGPHGAVHHQHRLDPPTAAVVDSVADLPGLLQG